jgi:cell division protein FtsA
MARSLIVSLEIGTSKVLALVAEEREDDHVAILGMGQQPSAGVRKGEIIDLENAVTCVRAALQEAEKSSQNTIREIHLAVSGGHIRSVLNRGSVPVMAKSGEITPEDVDQVVELARAVSIPEDREVLHTICQHFCIDDQEKVLQPEGMEGTRLSLDMLVLHGVRRRLHNSVRVVRSIPVDVEDVVFSGLCSALAVVTAEQKQGGVVVIDLGGGVTDYLAYAGNVVVAAGALGVGGDHVTNDVAIAFRLSTAQAEQLKRESGCAPAGRVGATQQVTLPPEGGFAGKAISLRSLQTVIHARAEETLSMVRQRLEADGVLRHLGAGVVLTGGGARLGGLAALGERVFGLPCAVGGLRNVSGLAAAVEGAECATCAGLARYAFRAQAESRRRAPIPEWLRGLFKR